MQTIQTDSIADFVLDKIGYGEFIIGQLFTQANFELSITMFLKVQLSVMIGIVYWLASITAGAAEFLNFI